MSQAVLWDELHKDPKQRLLWPSEHVIRWLANMNGQSGGRALDIGCGAGRHWEPLRNAGFHVRGVDASAVPCVGTVADMRDLPFTDGVFDAALAFGVFYYGTFDDHQQAVRELHRVLRPGGQALVVTRSYRDTRSKHLQEGKVMVGDERGMVMNFLDDTDIPVVYGGFRGLNFELTETTRCQRAWVDSDWLIRLTK